jgi:hypothetical protein
MHFSSSTPMPLRYGEVLPKMENYRDSGQGDVLPFNQNDIHNNDTQHNGLNCDAQHHTTWQKY